VASGLLPASEVVKLDGKSAETIGGELVWIDVDGQSIYLNESTPADPLIIISDIKTSNGIIHVIDAVMVPQDIVETAVADGRFDILVEAVVAAGLDDDLSAPNGPYTVFAPTDAAFAALLVDLGITKAELLANPDLGSILAYHVLGDAYDSTAVVSWDGATTPATLNGATITVDVRHGTVYLNERTEEDPAIIEVDIKTSNGIIHVIDGVLIPPAPAS
jgi:uncharacterized surface protein with fasciclin (FAS1) repeats